MILNLNKNVEDNVVFLNLKAFISAYFSVVSYKQEMHKSLLQEAHKLSPS